MKILLKVQSIALVLLLLCSVCVAPVMAETPKYVTEDGVHLIKYDNSPTQTDPNFYRLNSADDIVVDGNHFYWVRIGNEKAKMLSKNDMANLLCRGVFALATGAGVAIVLGVASATEVGSEGIATPVALPWTAGALASLIEFGSDYAAKFCDIFETWFVTDKYRYVASDGTILIGIAKTNTAGITELKKDGIDITKLTLLSADGKISINDITTRIKPDL